VKYPDYTPLETMYYCLTGCVQFFRTSALRQVGGFDPSLYCAADYEVILKMVSARINVVHVPEVLTLFYQNTGGISQSTNRSAEEHALLTNRYRAKLDITEIFQVESNRPASVADAFAMLGISATKIHVPWEDQAFEHADFAFECFHTALKLDPENVVAGTHLIALTAKLNRLTQQEAELTARWPKMREWIANFRLGEGAYLPTVKHARLGPVYRPAEFSNRPTDEQLAREPKALQPWITRIDGRHVYLSEDFFPCPAGVRYTSEELQNAGKKLVELMMALPSRRRGRRAAAARLVLRCETEQRGVQSSQRRAGGEGVFRRVPRSAKNLFSAAAQRAVFSHLIALSGLHVAQLSGCGHDAER
jgi:hypothetical protein